MKLTSSAAMCNEFSRIWLNLHVFLYISAFEVFVYVGSGFIGDVLFLASSFKVLLMYFASLTSLYSSAVYQQPCDAYPKHIQETHKTSGSTYLLASRQV